MCAELEHLKIETRLTSETPVSEMDITNYFFFLLFLLKKMVKSATVREIFDEMSLNVTAFLEVLVLLHSHMLSYGYGSFFN